MAPQDWLCLKQLVEEARWQRLDRFETNFVDLTGRGGLLGQTAGRTTRAVTDWLDARGPA